MSENQATENTKAYAKIVARAWSDEAFKAELLADPDTVLKAHGVVLPDGVTAKIHAEEPGTRLFVLPLPSPELDDSQLDNIAGGVGHEIKGEIKTGFY